MATKFLEPGGDATFDVTTLWAIYNASGPAVATDFVHGGHVNSIKYRPNAAGDALVKTGVVGNSGRYSFYLYIAALPSATVRFAQIKQTADSTAVIKVIITSAGVLQIFNNTVQVGSNGSTLATGKWYRICLAWNLTSTTVNDIRLFNNGVVDISITNGTLTAITPADAYIGNSEGNLSFDLRSSDHYIDDSNALTDPGDIWVTAKRPFSNGTTNGFTTQIGAGGSGYGSGHAPQVNERALSTTNGWSMVGAGSAITEEYTIEGANVGDIDISAATIVDYMGWIYQKALVSETATIVTGGTSSTYATGTVNSAVTQIKGSTSYPGGGTDIGVITSTDLTTFSLYECGVVVAYIPASGTTIPVSTLLMLGAG